MTFSQPPKTTLSRAVYRSPIVLYRMGLGGLLGRRFLMLTHRGRTTGLERRVVLEVVGRSAEPGHYFIVSGYGSRAQWFRNIRHDPHVRYQVGWRHYEGTATILRPEESGRALARYAARRPRTAAGLMRGIGHGENLTPEAYRRIGADTEDGTPIVALRPTREL